MLLLDIGWGLVGARLQISHEVLHFPLQAPNFIIMTFLLFWLQSLSREVQVPVGDFLIDSTSLKTTTSIF